MLVDRVSPDIIVTTHIDECTSQILRDKVEVESSLNDPPPSPTRMAVECVREKAGVSETHSTFFPISHHKRMASHPKHSVDEDSIVFFDWDDTLLCTSYLKKHGLHVLSNEDELRPHMEVLNRVAHAVVNVIMTALQFSPVCIVTNAEEGWIQKSAHRFIPNVLPWLLQVHIISARSMYENVHPNTPVVWKYAAFKDLLNATVLKGPMRQKNVLNFGDSMAERDAILAATREYICIKTKSLKFQHEPSIDMIIEQLDTTAQNFEVIHGYIGHIDTSLNLMGYSNVY